MAYSFDIAAAVKLILDKILNTNILLVLCTDSRSLYQCLVKLDTTQEKRFIINVICLRQAYERREIGEVKQIKKNTNLVDIIIKSKTINVLQTLIDSNKVTMDTEEQVERDQVVNKYISKATRKMHIYIRTRLEEGIRIRSEKASFLNFSGDF